MQVTLYKRSRSGKIQQWTVVVVGSSFSTSEGFVGGQISPTEPTFCEAKSVGKKNEVSAEQQAIKEAEARIEKQKKKGWVEDVNEVDSVVLVKPKLAEKWRDYSHKILEDVGSVWAMMPKLDGIRGLQKARSNKITSKEGNEIVAAPHINIALEEFMEGLDDKWITDGELYNHELKEDFNEISSIVRKKNLTQEDLKKSEQLMQFHIFDINAPGRFVERYTALQELMVENYNKYLKLVPVIWLKVADDPNETLAQIQKAYDQWLEEGYEGMMFQKADVEYEDWRSQNLIKRKEFIDAEFEITNIEEGRGNAAGKAAKVFCKDERGEIFSVGIKRNSKYKKTFQEYITDLLVNKDQYIGKMATVTYQNLTPDRQVPRFGKLKAIRDYE